MNQADCTCSIYLQWTADNVNDMYADAVLAVVLQIESNPKGLESMSTPHTHTP